MQLRSGHSRQSLSKRNCYGPLPACQLLGVARSSYQHITGTNARCLAAIKQHALYPGRGATSTVGDQMATTGRELRKLCVFCGASSGADPMYMAAAKTLGEHLVKENIGLVYGGGTVGLMGEVARTVQAGLGDDGVMGVLPEALAPREVSGALIGRTHIVQDMHTRKAMMAQHADGFIAMPGGFGTLEELMEVLTWQQLGFHTKPVALLNTGGFFDPLLDFFGHAVNQGFVRAHHNNVIVSSDPAELLQQMRAFQPPVSLVAAALNSTGPVGLDVSMTSRQADNQQTHAQAAAEAGDMAQAVVKQA